MHSVLSTEAFLHLSHTALEDVVSLDIATETPKRQLIEACVKWARHQLHALGNQHPSDEEIRDKMDNVLYKIRFPTMNPEEFAELTATSRILTLEEKQEIYVYIVSGSEAEESEV